MMNETVVMIGAGRVATHLAQALRERAGLRLVQVYSRTAEHARALAERSGGAAWTTSAEAVRTDADVYVFSLSDDALAGVARRVPANDGLWLHTAGSVPMNVFRGQARRYGVLYPLQTFSRERSVDFRRVPCFVEGCTAEVTDEVRTLAERLSDEVHELSSVDRAYLHLAAVFACNFTNHMYALADGIVRARGLDGSVLRPLIDETAAKIHRLTPREAQTGPAIRNDRAVLNRQAAMIIDPDVKRLYEEISRGIYAEQLKS